MRSVAQRAGWAGEGAVFHVAGSNLRASCSVDREPAVAHLVSSALAVCEAARAEEGPATLRVGGSSEGALGALGTHAGRREPSVDVGGTTRGQRAHQR